MKNTEANDFYDRIVDGQQYFETVTLTHESNAELEGVELHPVDKQSLSSVIEALPEELFEALEEADDPEEAEEMLDEEEGGEAGSGLAAMNEKTVTAFENLVKESARHPELTNTQMADIIDALDFVVLFELGGKIIDMSYAKSGSVKDFREQE